MTEEKVICLSCEKEEALKGYPTDLCEECREEFIKFPVPLWIKMVSIIILFIMLFGLISFKNPLTAAVNYERGLNAEKELKYVTAQIAYKKALKKFPKSQLLKSRLFISLVKGDDLAQAEKIYDEIMKMEYSDDDLFNEVQSAVDLYGKSFFLTEEIEKIIKNQNLSLSQKISGLENLSKSNKNGNMYGTYYYLGEGYFANQEYEKSIEALNNAYNLNKDFYFLKISTAAAYKELGNYEKAKKELDVIFKFNKEYEPSYVYLSFINLREHNYKDALINAEKAYSLNKNDLDAVEAIVISNHYLKNEQQKYKYMEILEKNNFYGIDRTKDILSGKIKDYE